MQERFITNKHGTYRKAEYNPEAKHGLTPLVDRVIITPDEPVVKTAGGILLTEQKTDQLKWGAESGVIIAIGPDAFRWLTDRTRESKTADLLKPGDRVVFNAYAGVRTPGLDGQWYLILRDNDIGARID